jgi:hypothetical protein
MVGWWEACRSEGSSAMHTQPALPFARLSRIRRSRIRLVRQRVALRRINSKILGEKENWSPPGGGVAQKARSIRADFWQTTISLMDSCLVP